MAEERIDLLQLADAIEGFAPIVDVDGRKTFCLAMGERQRNEVLQALRFVGLLPVDPVEGGGIVSKEEVDSAIESLKAGRSVFFKLGARS